MRPRVQPNQRRRSGTTQATRSPNGPVGWIEFLDLVPAVKTVLGSGVESRADFPSEGVEPR
jgi:hypothetical protein